MLIESVESSYLSEEKRFRTGRPHRHQQLPTRKLPHSQNPGKADYEVNSAVLDDVSLRDDVRIEQKASHRIERAACFLTCLVWEWESKSADSQQAARS